MKAILTLIALVIIGAVIWMYITPETDSVDTAETTPEAEITEENTSTEEAAEVEGAMVAQDLPVDAEADIEVTADAEAVVIEMDSFNFGYSQEEIRVAEGTTVTIELTNSDGFHDWVVDEFDAATEKIREGETTSVTFVADQAGTYEYYCSVGSHRANGMVGTLIVE